MYPSLSIKICSFLADCSSDSVCEQEVGWEQINQKRIKIVIWLCVITELQKAEIKYCIANTANLLYLTSGRMSLHFHFQLYSEGETVHSVSILLWGNLLTFVN